MNIVVKTCTRLSFLALCIFACVWAAWLAFIHYHSIDFTILERTDTHPSLILDDEGNVLTQFARDKRNPVAYQTIPRHVIDAFCAAEDWYFFSHHGLSYRGILRSLLVNAYYGKKMQGASTITQQLVKLLFFDNRKTFSRKIKEQWYALLLEQQYTKEYILQTYLNNVCFGCGIYGIEAASQRFWGLSASQISIAQAATLAGIIRRPEYYCPLHSPLIAQKRRNVVLKTMHSLSWISDKEYHQAIDEPVTIIYSTHEQYGLYIKEMIRKDLECLIAKDELYTKGFIIQSTINSSLQQKAETLFKEHCTNLSETMQLPINGALVSLSSHTGEIKALVGGVDYQESSFNRVTQAFRQMGSIIKPIIYGVAMEQGFSFADIEIDEPFTLTNNNITWSPHNYDKQFQGPITLAHALSCSNNIVTIKTLLKIGTASIHKALIKAGITASLHHYPSLALGCIDSTLLEATGMFNLFANHGVYVKPHYIRWVKNNMGEKIMKNKSYGERVLSSHATGKVMKVLMHGIERIRLHRPGPWIDAEAISKTGTTNESRTCWFMGSTPSLTTGVYIGCDDNRSMGTNVYPIKTAFPLWLSFNSAIQHPVKKFLYDAMLKEITINKYSGKEVHKGSSQSYTIMV